MDSNAMFISRQLLGILVALVLLAGTLAGAGAVLAQGPRAPVDPIAPDQGSLAAGQTVPAATVGSGSAGGGAAIAYPYPIFGGSPGIAPDHTIVVTGTGQADLESDGSDRAAAEKSALVAALADAKGQAGIIASTLGLTIKNVVSVSASVGSYGPLPMAMGAAPGQAPRQPAPAPGVPQPVWQAALNVSVTVVYAIG